MKRAATLLLPFAAKSRLPAIYFLREVVEAGKTAKALGLTIPQSVLASVTEIIQ